MSGACWVRPRHAAGIFYEQADSSPKHFLEFSTMEGMNTEADRK